MSTLTTIESNEEGGEIIPIKSQNEIIDEFLNSLNEKDKKSYNIAKTFLGSSFDILKCNIFLEYQKQRKDEI